MANERFPICRLTVCIRLQFCIQLLEDRFEASAELLHDEPEFRIHEHELVSAKGSRRTTIPLALLAIADALKALVTLVLITPQKPVRCLEKSNGHRLWKVAVVKSFWYVFGICF